MKVVESVPRAVISAAVVLLSEAAEAAQPQRFSFFTSDYVIDMVITFLPPYSGRPFTFYRSFDPAKPVCVPERGVDSCWNRFVGSVAMVNFAVKRRDGTTPKKISIREQVSVLDHSCGIPAPTPLSMAVHGVNGKAADLQVFGYDERDLTEADRGGIREQMKREWLSYRQELYLGGDEKPFAVVEWKHTLERIELVRVYAAHERLSVRSQERVLKCRPALEEPRIHGCCQTLSEAPVQ